MDAAVLGLIGAVAAAIIGAVAAVHVSRHSKKLKPSDLRLINFYARLIGGTTTDVALALDFTVRNTGEQPAVVTGLRVKCVRSMTREPPWPLDAGSFGGGLSDVQAAPYVGGRLEASTIIDQDLPSPHPSPFTIICPLMQHVPPNGIDRFAVRLSITGGLLSYYSSVRVLKLFVECADRVDPIDAGTVLCAPLMPTLIGERKRAEIDEFYSDVRRARLLIDRARSSDGLQPVSWADQAEYHIGFSENSIIAARFLGRDFGAPVAAVDRHIREVQCYLEDLQPVLDLAPFHAVEFQNEEITAGSIREYSACLRSLIEENQSRGAS